MRYFIVVLYFFSCQSLLAQELITDSSTVLKSGIYKDFFELKYNCPSLTLNTEINIKDVKIEYGTYVELRQDIGLENCYGFCDGVDIYIRLDSKIGFHPVFSTIELYGQFAFLPNYMQKTYGAGVSAMDFTVSETVSDNKILSITDGEIYPFKKYMVERIIAFDSLLYSDFLSEDDNKNEEILKEYLAAYSRAYAPFIPNLYDIETIALNKTEKEILHYWPNLLDTSYIGYTQRLKEFEKSRLYNAVRITHTYHKNGNIKSTVIKSMHSFGQNPDYYFKIGTHQKYHKDGKTKSITDYNLRGQKHGRYIVFTEAGEIIKNTIYQNDKIVKPK
jgi:antitoxin component YwqK of YwqJK toxin-antitoxin module